LLRDGGGSGSGLRREDLPPEWDVVTGREAGDQVKALMAAHSLRLKAKAKANGK